MLCEIQVTTSNPSDCIISSDFYSGICDSKSRGFNDIMNAAFIDVYSLDRCDVLFPGGSTTTYINESLSYSRASTTYYRPTL